VRRRAPRRRRDRLGGPSRRASATTSQPSLWDRRKVVSLRRSSRL
jgi:hypothetical protein